MIENNKDTYKVFISYPPNFKDGTYSLVAKNLNNKTTQDIQIQNINLWQKIKNIFEGFYKYLLKIT